MCKDKAKHNFVTHIQDMDILALIALLRPCLSALLELGGTAAAESMGSQIGTNAWETAKKIWHKLSPKLNEKEDARIATISAATGRSLHDSDIANLWPIRFRQILIGAGGVNSNSGQKALARVRSRSCCSANSWKLSLRGIGYRAS
jgi:hypothetical protein